MLDLTDIAGSSPRLWGTGVSKCQPEVVARFIPTPVGNGLGADSMIDPLTVHPHACGERSCLQSRISWIGGSSPRLWGTDHTVNENMLTMRFIPTPVGNGRVGSLCSGLDAVHPHACGERSPSAMNAMSGNGSSPRLWGTVVMSMSAAHAARFIPTPVGNGSSRGGWGLPTTVHPHACGERRLKNKVGIVMHGSSPRLWGTVQLRHHHPWQARFIPTPVGNGSLITCSASAKAVHPHACGERIRHRIARQHHFGSSPRLWGTAKRKLIRKQKWRFIPTPVGNGFG